jgi:hypothetical protein
MDNASDSTQDPKTHGVSILLGLAFCVFLYIALSGPAIRLTDSPICPDPVKKGIEFLYTPLGKLDNKIPGKPFTVYVLLWY